MASARAAAALLAVLMPMTAACAPAPEAPPQSSAPERVENDALGIAVAAVPAVFEVVAGDDATIQLGTPSLPTLGRITVSAGPIDPYGINLVEAVKARRAEFEAAPGGEYFGNRELGTPIGTAYTARGAYDGSEGRIEETWAFAVHPSANRLLTVIYAYPPGEGQERVGHLLELLGEIEAHYSGPS